MSTPKVDEILPTMVKQRGTLTLDLGDIQEYHRLLSRKRNCLKNVRCVTTFKNVIIILLFLGLPSYHTGTKVKLKKIV